MMKFTVLCFDSDMILGKVFTKRSNTRASIVEDSEKLLNIYDSVFVLSASETERIVRAVRRNTK
jgi:hypothetical protein